FNAFTVVSADRQWFHLPETSPPIAAGNLLPVSPELVRGYSRKAAAASVRRSEVSAQVQPKVGRALGDRDITVVTMSRHARDGASARSTVFTLAGRSGTSSR